MASITSRRHALFAAASSVVIGSGITADAAASVADLAEDSEAELVEIVAEARKLGAEHARLLASWWKMEATDAGLQPLAEALQIPHDRLCELSDQALTLQATSHQGWRAKAELLRHFLLVECEIDSPGQMVFNSFYQELAWSLVCDLTGRA